MNDKENQASQPIASELKISGVLNTSAEAIANIPRWALQNYLGHAKIMCKKPSSTFW